MSSIPSLKLGFLFFDYFPFGGLQRDCIAIARLCASRGHDVTLFTRTWEGDKPDGLKVKLFGRSGLTNETRNRNWIRQLKTAIPAANLDVVAGFNKLPGLDIYYGADPCYVATASRVKPPWYRWLPRYRHFATLEKAVFARGNPSELLMLTPGDIQDYQEHYGSESERFHVLPPNATRRNVTVEKREATRARIRRENNWPPDTQIILFVGSDFRRKGLERAIRAFASLNPEHDTAQMVVIGSASIPRFAGLARALDVENRVHYLGGRHDVPDWMLAADVLLHPAHVETAGIVLLEALTNGLPVIVTDVCGYAFHVARAAAGFVLPSPFDQEVCNVALETILMKTMAGRFRAGAFAYAGREDLYSCHARVATIIEKVGARRPRAPSHKQAS